MNAMCHTPADAWSMWLLWGRQGGAGLRECVFSADMPFLRTWDMTRWEVQTTKREHPPSPEWSSWYPTSLPQPHSLSSPDCPFTRPEAEGLKGSPGHLSWSDTWRSHFRIHWSCGCIAGCAHLPSKPSPTGTFDLSPLPVPCMCLSYKIATICKWKYRLSS